LSNQFIEMIGIWEGLRDVSVVAMDKYKVDVAMDKYKVDVAADESCRSLVDAQKNNRWKSLLTSSLQSWGFSKALR
jgi:hypothetical protein